MKLNSLLTAALLPVGLMAAPITEEAADVVAREPVDVSPNEPAGALIDRNTTMCKIVGASAVNCRSGPGTGYRVVATFERGLYPIFSCVKSGQCITVGGSVNCGWHYVPAYAVAGDVGCYVNGHYTDSTCTLAYLGRC